MVVSSDFEQKQRRAARNALVRDERAFRYGIQSLKQYDPDAVIRMLTQNWQYAEAETPERAMQRNAVLETLAGHYDERVRAVVAARPDATGEVRKILAETEASLQAPEGLGDGPG